MYISFPRILGAGLGESPYRQRGCLESCSTSRGAIDRQLSFVGTGRMRTGPGTPFSSRTMTTLQADTWYKLLIVPEGMNYSNFRALSLVFGE